MALEGKELHEKQRKSLRVIRNVYLYLVSMIGLIVFVFGAVGIVNNVFQNYIFQVDYDSYYETYPVKGGTPCAQPFVDITDKEGKRMITPTTDEIAKCEENLVKQKEQNKRNRIGQEFSIAIAQLAVGLPIWLFHWAIIQKEARRKEEE